jgi:hypothetical protein
MENCHAVPSLSANAGFDRRESWEDVMSGQTVKIRSSEGGEFDCYLVAPKADAPNTDATMPAIVLTSAVHGVDADIREIADEFAANGVVAAAPDLFWRTLPGPVSHDDGRAQQRSQPRLEKIKTGERDLVDTLAYLRTLPQFNGQAAVMGFCYGGPTRSSDRSGSATRPEFPATAPSSSITSRSSTASARRCASSGATATAGRRPRCWTPIATFPRA